MELSGPDPEPQIKEIAQPVADEAVPEPQIEVMAEPVIEQPSEPQVEVISEPVIERPSEPQVEAISEPVIERPPEEEKSLRAATPRKRRSEAKSAQKNADTEENTPAPVIWEKLVFDVRETLCKKALAQAMLAAKVISFNGSCLLVAFDAV